MFVFGPVGCVKHLFCNSSTSSSSSSSWLMTSEASHWNSVNSVLSESKRSHSSIIPWEFSGGFSFRVFLFSASLEFRSFDLFRLCHSKWGGAHLTQLGTEID